MIRFHIYTRLKKTVSGLFLAILFLFTISACTSSEAELAQKVQTLSKEEKITALRTEIQMAIKAEGEVSKYSCIGWNGTGITDDRYDKKALNNILRVLITSHYAADLSSDELLTILKMGTGLPVDHIIRPKTNLDHVIVGLRSCKTSSHHTALHRFYLLDRAGYMQLFARGTLLDDWTFPDGEALFLNTGNIPAGTTPLALYRIYNDGTELQVRELVFDPEAYFVLKSNITFDENGERFTTYISSYGTWQPPCEYTAEFTKKYKVAIDWDVTLSYTFDDGRFILEEREYGDLKVVSHEHTIDEWDFHTISEWQQLCVSGTLRPTLP